MFSPFFYLYVAMNLSVLTYTIGAMIMALPIPIHGLKKWGPRLIGDSIYSAVLVNVYGGILYLIQEISQALGVSWANFGTWIETVISEEISIYTFVRAFSGLFSSLDPAIAIFFAPLSYVISILTGIITATETFLVLAFIINNYYGLFIALGIGLMSIPFRVGRGIGASLISFSIVFEAGLPYLPNFLQGLGMNPLDIELGMPTSAQLNNALTYMTTILIPTAMTSLLIMPLVYLGILSGLSMGLSYAIGGSQKLPIPVEIF
ncbi:DNA import protein CedA [Sulfuracidifex tepidarius]|nr:DNA import protein CedA [Sulfuracidifex tepidarius]